MKRLFNAYMNSIAGLRYGFANETAVRQEIILLLVGLPIAWVISGDLWRFTLLISTLMLLLMVELLNTAIEALADKITLEHSEQIKIAKDCGSAAVMFAGFIAMAVWAHSLWDYFFAIS